MKIFIVSTIVVLNSFAPIWATSIECAPKNVTSDIVEVIDQIQEPKKAESIENKAKLYWNSNVQLPVALAEKMGKLNEQQLLEFAKNELGLQVIVVEHLTAGKTINPALKDLQISDNVEVIKFYNEDTEGRTAFTDPKWEKAVIGEFLPPYSHMFPRDKTEYKDRPLKDSPLLLVNRTANRRAIIHEIMHAVVWKARDEKAVDIDGKLMDQLGAVEKKRKDMTFASRILAAAEKKLIEKSLREGLSLEEKEALYKIWDTYIDYISAVIGQIQRSQQEEMDIDMFLFDQRAALKLTESEQENILKLLLGYFRMHEQNLKVLGDDSTLLNIAVEGNGQKLPEDLQKKYDKFLDVLKDINEKDIGFSKWFNPAGDAFRKDFEK